MHVRADNSSSITVIDLGKEQLSRFYTFAAEATITDFVIMSQVIPPPSVVLKGLPAIVSQQLYVAISVQNSTNMWLVLIDLPEFKVVTNASVLPVTNPALLPMAAAACSSENYYYVNATARCELRPTQLAFVGLPVGNSSGKSLRVRVLACMHAFVLHVLTLGVIKVLGFLYL